MTSFELFEILNLITSIATAAKQPSSGHPSRKALMSGARI